MIEINKIKQLYPNHFQVILDYPTPQDLVKILDKSYKYVWVVNHNEVRSSWLPYTHTLYGVKTPLSEVFVRNVRMEYLVHTASFIEFLPNIKQTVHLIQTNVEPPHYLNLDRLEGKQKYDLLKNQLDYRLEIEIPGASDYAPLVSPDKTFLELILKQL